MATTVCSSLLPLVRSPCPPRISTAARSLGVVTAAGPLSSDLHFFGNSRRESGGRRQRVVPASAMTDDRVDLDENPEGIISGEWPDNFSLLCYDDLRAYLEPQIQEDIMHHSVLLGEVMSTQIRVATADQTLEEIEHHFEFVSGLPVIDSELRCVGVISITDKARAPHGVKSKVGEVMSSPAITLSSEKTVTDAAALMFKMKIHRIPVLNKERQVVGIVTGTDIFQALETLVV